jgi:hypothetical protein
MEEAPINFALGIFVAVVAMGLFYLWRKAADLRDALRDQDGYRLMVIFARIFLISAVTSTLGAVRWFSLVVMPDYEWLRQAIGFFNAMALISVSVWALLAIRALIDSNHMPHE